ncbi:MAG: hypothetical protein ACRDV9_13525, partial [Acidimicrobiia bacterium]
WEGDWAGAESQLSAARDRARRAGNRLEEWGIARWLSLVARLEGRGQEAERTLDEALALAAGAPFPAGEVATRVELALIAVQSGAPKPARQHLGRARELMGDLGPWRGLAGRLLFTEAVLRAADGHLEEAEGRFGVAIEMFRRYCLPWDEAEVFHAWGSALVATGSRISARRRFDAALSLYERSGAGASWMERMRFSGAERSS